MRTVQTAASGRGTHSAIDSDAELSRYACLLDALRHAARQPETERVPALIHMLRSVLEFTRADLALFDAASGLYSLRTVYEERPGIPLVAADGLPPDTGLTGLLLRTGAVCRIWQLPRGTGDLHVIDPDLESGSLAHAMSIRLQAGSAVTGALHLASLRHRYDPVDVRLGISLGFQLALLLERDRAQLARTAAEAARLAVEARFDQFMRHLPGLAWIKDLNGRYVFANPRAISMLGPTRTDLRNCTDDDLFTPEEAARVRENDARALNRSGGMVTTETIGPNDRPRHFLVSRFPMLGVDGRVTMLGTVAFDISDHVETESALRFSEERFRTLAESAPICVWTASTTGAITYATKKWFEFSGLDPDCEDRFDWIRTLHPDDRERALVEWTRAVRTGQPCKLEVRQRRADGAWRWLLTQALPLHDESGRITGWVGTSTDIDDQKRVAETLRDADRRKDEFLATLGHELRNPLQPIRSAVDALRLSGSWNSENVVEMLERQVKHMNRLVDDLLEISRIARGKLTLHRETVDLARIIDLAVEGSRQMFEAAGHSLEIRLPDEPVLLHADPTRLAQVFSNLLNNAASYTTRGGHIHLSAERRANEVVVRVADTGIGISRAALHSIFDIFERGAGESEQYSPEGMGIGLAVVRRLVELHGGRVEAHSAGLGEGSVFAVFLPLAPPKADAPQPARTGGRRQGSLSGRRILVVEDNRDAAESLAMLLQACGAEARMVNDGPAALETCSAFRPDAVLLDIGMPGMNGYEVARRIRARPDMNGVLLVALTGWGQEEDRQRALEAGFDHHCVKPVELEVLRRVLTTPPPPRL